VSEEVDGSGEVATMCAARRREGKTGCVLEVCAAGLEAVVLHVEEIWGLAIVLLIMGEWCAGPRQRVLTAN